jgi:biopolymer transport protein ExbD
MIRLARHKPARRPGMVAMIDVVFLLIVFFMVAARLDRPEALPLSVATGGAGGWQGPPRLIELAGTGLALNGVSVAAEALIDALEPLMSGPDDPVILLVGEGATVGDVAALIARLNARGIDRLVMTTVGGQP